MAPIIQFKCRACDGDVSLAPASKVDKVSCPSCRTALEVSVNDSLVGAGTVTRCVSCGHDTFYVQKDFNRTLGVAIVVAGFAVSIYYVSQGEPFYAMAALFIMAMVDFLIYFLVRNVTVCYACHAVYRGFERNPEHEPFDLKKLEKYGGREPRFGGPRP